VGDKKKRNTKKHDGPLAIRQFGAQEERPTISIPLGTSPGLKGMKIRVQKRPEWWCWCWCCHLAPATARAPWSAKAHACLPDSQRNWCELGTAGALSLRGAARTFPSHCTPRLPGGCENNAMQSTNQPRQERRAPLWSQIPRNAGSVCVCVGCVCCKKITPRKLALAVQKRELCSGKASHPLPPCC